MSNNRKKGFTLVELMIVIVIIGILAAIIIPSVSSAIEKAKFANDQSDAKNMNTILMTYCAENNIDTKSLEAPEVRYIVSTGDKNYTFVPKAKNSVYWYNMNEGMIEVVQTTSYETPTSMLNNVYADDLGNSVEEIKKGYLYLNTTGELATLLSSIRGLTETQDFTAITNKADALGFKAHIEQFNPAQTLYISSTSIFHKCSDKISKIVFAENISYIGNFNKKRIEFTNDFSIQLPVSVKVVDDGAFFTVSTPTKINAKNKNTKIVEGALSTQIKTVSNIENITNEEVNKNLLANNKLISIKVNDNVYTIETSGSSTELLGRIDLGDTAIKIDSISVDTTKLVQQCKGINAIDIKYVPAGTKVDIYIRVFDDNGILVNMIVAFVPDYNK